MKDHYYTQNRKSGLYELLTCADCVKLKRKNYRDENKEIVRISFKKWYEENKEYYKNYRNKWYAENKEKAKKTRDASYARDSSKFLNRVKKYNVKYREKARARNILHYHLRVGNIKKPDICSVCQNTFDIFKIHGHHHDYTKPLDVVWCCAQCHKDIHSRILR